MAERELIAARVKAEALKADFQRTVEELKYRLKPATLASDAWHGIRDKGVEYSGLGNKAVHDRPGVAGGAVFALLLFFLRHPLGRLVSRIFGGPRVPGTVKADVLDAKTDYDLTAPVVAMNQGAKQ